MFRYALLQFVLAAAVYCQKIELEDFFNEHLNQNKSFDALKCDDIDGELSGCYSCYSCDHPRVQEHIGNKDDMQKIKLKNSQCEQMDVCCFSQLVLGVHRINDKCGKMYQEGWPRLVRHSLRTILQGEYPWRAWIFNLVTNTRLCAATYINSNSRAFLTSATCVLGARPEHLAVRFNRTRNEQSLVDRILVHEKFVRGKLENDIAIVFLRNAESVPKWAVAACQPAEPPPPGTSCVIASTTDLVISTVIPQQRRCDPFLHDSLLCGFTPYDDETPGDAEGLFCMDDNSNTDQFYVYGIMLSHVSSKNVFTNIVHHLQWLSSHNIY